MPDNPLAVSRVMVSVDGRRVAEVEASLIAEDFKRSGWHSTGQCVFIITEAQVPGLSGLPRLELYDADTNVLVHRRVSSPAMVRDRLCLIDASIEPETILQNTLFPYFERSYFNIQRMSDEVISGIFTNTHASSILLSGALTVPRYENFMTPDLMITAILLQDPHVEMAARMRWLRARAGDASDPARNWRLGPLAEAASFAASFDFTDAKSLKRFFRMLPEPAYRLLYNPLTRQLGTRMPEDRLHPGNSIAAIEVLSRIEIVGHRTRFDAFAATLFDRLGIRTPIPVVPPCRPRRRHWPSA
ncbi:hypothetical protein ACRAWG_30470 [Methylobacterium sp. P31]